MPSFSRHDGRPAERDTNGDGRVDERDDRYVAGMDERAAADRDGTMADRDGTVDDRDGTVDDRDRDRDRDRAVAERTAAARLAERDAEHDARRDPRTDAVDTDGDGRADTVVAHDRDTHVTDDRDTHVTHDKDTVVTDKDRTVAPVGPRPRASFMATLSLIFGMAGAAFVLSGALAGYGIALGAIAVVLAVFGLSATRRRHVAGKTDALLGFGIGAAAVVIGILAMTDSFVWPTMDADWVSRLREWLDSQFIDRF